jgi:uncharacterized protein involved in exopolysaccharide biosynthesis
MDQEGESFSATGPTTPLSVANFMLRHRRVLVGLPALAFVFSLSLSVAFGVGYASRSSFVPQPRESAGSRISALAAQFALIAGGPGTSESVEFYAQLLRSRELLTQAARSIYVLPPTGAATDSARGTLVDFWKPPGREPDTRMRTAVARLDRQVEISTSRDANTVTLVTRAESPALAVQINRRLLELVGEFNLQKRQSRAAAERRFASDRLQGAQAELEAAESTQRRFLEQNREYQSSPQLRFEAARLERRVNLRQEVALALAQSYEQARIDEVRDTPVITVVDRPEFSIRRARSRLLDAIVWALVGGLFAFGLALGVEYLSRERGEGNDVYREFRELTGATIVGRLARHLRGEGRKPAGSE